jgi:hypothetical protein
LRAAGKPPPASFSFSKIRPRALALTGSGARERRLSWPTAHEAILARFAAGDFVVPLLRLGT